MMDQKCPEFEKLRFWHFLNFREFSLKLFGRSVSSHSHVFLPNSTQTRPFSLGMGRVPTALIHQLGPNTWDPNRSKFIWNKIFQIYFPKFWEMSISWDCTAASHPKLTKYLHKFFAQIFWYTLYHTWTIN